MPRQRMYHEYVDGELIPFWYVLTFDSSKIQWDKSVLHYEVIKPFDFVERDEFDESIASISIFLSDLIFNETKPNVIGLNLNSIKGRIDRYGIEPELIHQFVLSTPELNDLLELLPTERKIEFCIA
jgi:hypothetical protein